MKKIKKVDYSFVKRIFSPIPHTILLCSKYQYYVLIVDDLPVSMIAHDNKRIHSAYTPLSQRGKGYSTLLFRHMADLGINESLYTKDSVNICRRIGFVQIRRYDKTNKAGDAYSLWLMRKGDCDYGKTKKEH